MPCQVSHMLISSVSYVHHMNCLMRVTCSCMYETLVKLFRDNNVSPCFVSMLTLQSNCYINMQWYNDYFWLNCIVHNINCYTLVLVSVFVITVIQPVGLVLSTAKPPKDATPQKPDVSSLLKEFLFIDDISILDTGWVAACYQWSQFKVVPWSGHISRFPWSSKM